MSDPKAVEELKRGAESYGRGIEESRRKVQKLDRNGDGRVDKGAQP